MKLIGLMAVYDEHIIYQPLNAFWIWNFYMVIFLGKHTGYCVFIIKNSDAWYHDNFSLYFVWNILSCVKGASIHYSVIISYRYDNELALNTNESIVAYMAQFDTTHLCINTCIDKHKLEFPRTKIEPQYFCLII